MLPSLRPIPVGEMCARYTLRKRHLAEVAEALGAEVAAGDEELFKPRYNVAPTDLAWVVVSSADTRVLRPAMEPIIQKRAAAIISGAADSPRKG